MVPSVQGGERPFDATEPLQKFQDKISALEKSIEELKKKAHEAKELKGKCDEEERGRNLQSLKVEEKKYDIAELFSPPRMTERAKEFGLKGGWSIDDRVKDPITKRTYDLRNRKDQNEIRRMIRRDKPLVLTVSPPCTLFSIANQGPIDSKELAGAVELMKFAVEVCDIQKREGRYFVFEQPQGSRA